MRNVWFKVSFFFSPSFLELFFAFFFFSLRGEGVEEMRNTVVLFPGRDKD